MANYWMEVDPPIGQQQDDWYGQQQQQTGLCSNFDQSFQTANAQSYYSTARPSSENFYGTGLFNPGNQNAIDSVPLDDEIPLLEELGINFDNIRQKTFAVLNPMSTANADVIADQDLAGPLVFCLLFGASLLLHGKVQFGYIYGIGVVGCLGIYALLGLMTVDGLSLTCTVSVLGYCLLPMAILSLLAAVLSLQGVVGYLVSGMAVLWCSFSSSKLFVITLSMDGQRLLVAYPCTLLYGVFALLAIF